MGFLTTAAYTVFIYDANTHTRTLAWEWTPHIPFPPSYAHTHTHRATICFPRTLVSYTIHHALAINLTFVYVLTVYLFKGQFMFFEMKNSNHELKYLEAYS